MRPCHPPCKHTLNARGIESGKKLHFLRVKLKSRLAAIRETPELRPENFDKRKPSSSHQLAENGLIGDYVVQIPILEAAIQRTEITLHIRNGKLTIWVEIKEEAKTPTLPENADDTVFLAD